MTFNKTSEDIVAVVNVSTLRANIVAFVLLVPIALMYLTPFVLVWGISPIYDGFIVLKQHKLILLLVLILGIIIHEGLHGLTWALFAFGGLKAIHFGIKWMYLTPYCHCAEPLQRNQYLLGGIMPGIITGILPAIVATVFGCGWLLLVGIFFTGAAGGDLIVLYKLLKFDTKYTIQDHPDEIGFIVRRVNS